VPYFRFLNLGFCYPKFVKN